MGRKVRLIIVGVFVLILAGLAFYNNQEKSKYSVLNNIATPLLQSLPEFSAVDIFGDKISTANLQGKNVFIQFIDLKSDSQIESLKRVCRSFKKDELTIIVFVKDSESHVFGKFMDEIRFAVGDIYIITKNHEQHKRTLNASSCCEDFYLFDNSGNLIVKDSIWRLHEIEAINVLTKFINNERFSVLKFIKPGQYIKDIDGLNQISEIIENEKEYDYFVISMFTDVCGNCLTGEIINELKKKNDLYHDSIYFLILLSDDFSTADINNLKEIIKIKIPVRRAKGELLGKWKKLREEYGMILVNNIVFLINKDREIVDVMIKNRWQEFFIKMDSIVEDG